MDAFASEELEECAPIRAVGGTLELKAREKFHCSSHNRRCGALERQSLKSVRFRVEEIGQGPFTEHVMPKCDAIIAEIA
jgi:hypothetical protein